MVKILRFSKISLLKQLTMPKNKMTLLLIFIKCTDGEVDGKNVNKKDPELLIVSYLTGTSRSKSSKTFRLSLDLVNGICLKEFLIEEVICFSDPQELERLLSCKPLQVH